MKGPCCTVVASMIAASTVAFSSSSTTAAERGMASQGSRDYSSTGKSLSCCSGCGEEEQGKFVPRFDGLRFIETLVTAHR
ncbi:hypothetical protein LINPERPRIM_LOCUS24250 [Linum perenne]